MEEVRSDSFFMFGFSGEEGLAMAIIVVAMRDSLAGDWGARLFFSSQWFQDLSDYLGVSMSKQQKLREMANANDATAAEARRLFDQLPDDEISMDEPVEFAVAGSRLLVARGRDTYWLEGDVVVRLHRKPAGLIVTYFREGAEVDLPALGSN